MYFPYLRGRQNELLAIRELVELGKLSAKVIPIIEPVKLSSTLYKTLEVFVNKGKDIGLVMNPTVGDFDFRFSGKDEEKRKYYDVFGSENITKCLIMNRYSQDQLDKWSAVDCDYSKWIAINVNRDYLDLYNKIFCKEFPKYSLVRDEFRRKIKNGRVLFENRFVKCDRNADYANEDKVDESYSEDHLYYKDEGYVGFSDYSIIGDEFIESGFAPYAVAIHIVYFDESNALRIHHFVSDSNDDIRDPAGKFYEAAKKLKDWVDETKITVSTIGIEKILEHYNNGTYPGLGSIKKYSLMHHLELMSNYLGEVE